MNGTTDPIVISIPFTSTLANASAGEAPCIGIPTNATAAKECPSTIECRYWDKVRSPSH